MTGARRRLDLLLVERGLAETRARAQALIAAGLVASGGQTLTRASLKLPETAPLEVAGRDHPWVSRGGIKLDHALRHFGLLVEGMTCLDLGASTGGFTQVLLARGAQRVYALDVGHGQLAPSLAADPRVLAREGINVRHIGKAEVPEAPDLIVADLSFISLTKALPAALALLKPGGEVVALVKPQFELTRRDLDKRGVVRDPARAEAAVRRVARWLEAQPGFRLLGETQSPISGQSGNREFLLAARRLPQESGAVSERP